MNWKRELKLADLEPETPIEVTCKRCGQSRYETPAQLKTAEPELDHLYLDELEYSLHCKDKFCRGGVRIALIHDDKTEGFVGGMA